MPPEPPDVAALRREYQMAELDAATAPDDPLELFGDWLGEVAAAGVVEPNAMVLATVGAEGLPSARTVLLKGYDSRGFTFFTNLTSRKANELGVAARAALVFPWYELQRQVEVAGGVEPVDGAETDAYWSTRPRASQMGAWASHQSTVIGERAVLERRWAALEERFGEAAIPRPPFWGGLRVVPERMEFWQGRRSRLHDRVRYSRPSNGHDWLRERLAP